MTGPALTTESFPPGARILARDEEWLVKTSRPTERDGHEIRAVGVTEFVQGVDVVLFSAVERAAGRPITLLRPEDTVLVTDTTPRFRRSRLFLEAVLRRTPLPRTARGLALADRFLLDPLGYQRRPAEMALAGDAPRILLADVVGLGKTLEIGLTLAELIRRGRGERILVVTPQHILEQFQHELWTRFSIPLVRLDSVGVERIQREIPAGRNPFTYFKRVIVSIDTLKNVGRYGHHLEQTSWDVVVIDESHNLIGQSSLRNRLARLLARRTDALLLASATPHNGDRESFAELIRMLDPTAIRDPKAYSAADIEHLYLRRTKVSPEVRDQIGDRWADREAPQPIHCPATPAEEAVFAELTDRWLAGPADGTRDRLFAYTLLKAFLSSHRALAETVHNRLKATGAGGGEHEALLRLAALADEIGSVEKNPTEPDRPSADRPKAAQPAKLTALIARLREAGVGASDTRVVIFSERVATLKWLAKVVPPLLGVPALGVRVMHGGVTDTEQQRIVEEFSLAGSPVRLLFTGDIASEGVNLHRECHHLIHYDIPWSLIRIEQRNGRIDRYGQTKPPRFEALILTSTVEGAKDDTTVAEKLLLREQAAHASIGTAEAVTGLFDAKKEEDRLTLDLLRGRSVEESLGVSVERDVLSDLLGEIASTPHQEAPARTLVPSLFAATGDFVDEALREVYASPEDDVELAREDQLLALTAPDDLVHRLADLPRSYLAAQRVNGRVRMRLTFDKPAAQRSLDAARRSDTTIWPQVHFVSEIHPVVEWLVDKVLVRLGRQEAPVLIADVDAPVVLIQSVRCDAAGHPIDVRWLAVSDVEGRTRVEPMTDVLAAAGVGPAMANPGTAPPLAQLQPLLPAAIDAVRAQLASETDETPMGEPLLRVLAVLWGGR